MKTLIILFIILSVISWIDIYKNDPKHMNPILASNVVYFFTAIISAVLLVIILIHLITAYLP